MKNTIHGFNQKELVELGLDNDDALILRWFVDFKDTGKMVSRIVNNEKYYWIKYEGMINDLPILKLKTKDALYRRLKKIDKTGVIKHTIVKENGTYSFYALGEKYIKLIVNDYSIGNKSEVSEINPKGTEINPKGTEINPEQNINLLNKSTKYNICASCDAIWRLYPKKKGKAQAYKKIPGLISKYGFEQLERAVKRYKDEINNENTENKYIAYGSTFFNSKYMDYLDDNYENIEKDPKDKTDDDAFKGMRFL